MKKIDKPTYFELLKEGLEGVIEIQKNRRYMPRKKKDETQFTHFEKMNASDRCFEICDHVIALIQSEAIGSPGYELAIDLIQAIAKFKHVSAMRK
jgi:hypothetical protein